MKLYLAALMPLLVAACTNVDELPSAVDFTTVADPAQGGVGRPQDVSVEYVPRSITDPADWRSVNDAQGENGT